VIAHFSNRCTVLEYSNHSLVLFGLLFLAISAGSVLYPWALICTKAKVANLSDRSSLCKRDLPGFIWQNPDSPRLRAFQSQLNCSLPDGIANLEKAIALRKWCREQQTGPWDTNDNSSEDPLKLLMRQRRGVSGTCRRFAYVFAGTLIAAGLDARVVAAVSGLYNWDLARHTMVEVWIPELDQWVLMDSMLNITYRVDGKPASLLQVYDAANTYGWSRIALDRDGSISEPAPTIGFHLPIFHHLLYAMSNAYFDGYQVSYYSLKRLAFVDFADYGWSRYPELVKNSLSYAAAGCFGVGTVAIFSVLMRLVKS
jgi:hypothetical protein